MRALAHSLGSRPRFQHSPVKDRQAQRVRILAWWTVVPLLRIPIICVSKMSTDVANTSAAAQLDGQPLLGDLGAAAQQQAGLLLGAQIHAQWGWISVARLETLAISAFKRRELVVNICAVATLPDGAPLMVA